MTTKNQVITLVVVALVCLAGGFGTGRFAAPTKTVVTEKLVQVETTKVVLTVDTQKVLDAIKTMNLQKNVHEVRIVEKEKDGTVRITDTKDDKSTSESKAETRETDNSKTAQTVEKTVYIDKEITKTVERTSRPKWAVDLTPGFDFAGALGHGSPINLLPASLSVVPHLVIGTSVTHRLIGPLSAGVWLNTAGMGGAVLRLEF